MDSGSRKPVLAVDLGGTKLIVALVSPDGRILAEERLATMASEGLSSVLERLFSALEHIVSANRMKFSDVQAISLAVAGAIDARRGVVTLSPNLPGWEDVPLRERTENMFKTRTLIINDAKAAALGEYRFGAGRGAQHLIAMTVGTGIGGGIIINGKLYLGKSGSAGEIGHMTIDINGPICACGNIGCLEMLASGKAIARDAIKRLEEGAKSSITQSKSNFKDVTAEAVGEAAKAGDPLAVDVIRRAATYLGMGLVNLVNIFNPEMIIVGGGVSKLGDLLLDPARRLIKERAFPIAAEGVTVKLAELGDEAGVYGAMTFAVEQTWAVS